MLQPWYPLRVKDGGIGLLTRLREDQIPTDAAVIARNLLHSEQRIQKRAGMRPVLTGTLDNVYRGGVPGASIYWWGDDRRVHDDRAGALSFETLSYNKRAGVGVMPEFTMSDLRLDVQAADNRWAIEVSFYADEVFTGPASPGGGLSRTKALLPVVIASKSDGQAFQWQILAKPAATEDAAAATPYVVLRLKNGTTAVTSDFYYNPGAVPSSFATRGRRLWFAWEFDGTNIISSYWKEGDAAALSTTQAVNYNEALLPTNGVGTATYPVIFGGMSLHGAGFSSNNTSRGFNGCTPEVRFWSSGAASPVSHPDWTSAGTNWYFEREIEPEAINADGTFVSSTFAHCQLYLQMAEQQIDADGRLVLPRAGKNSGGIDFTKNKVWLTGADAVWTSASGVGGNQALAFCPAADTPRQDDYYRAIVPTAGTLRQLFGGGIRIPDAIRYWQKQQSTTLITLGYRYTWNDGFSVRIAFRADGLQAAFTNQTLFDIRSVPGNLAAVVPALRIYLKTSGGSAKVAAEYDMVKTSGGFATTEIVNTTTLVEGTWYVVTATMQYIPTTTAATDFFARVRLYLGNALEASFDPNSIPDTVKKPFCSQDGLGGASDVTAPNKNDQNQAGNVVFMTIGCDSTQGVLGGETTIGGTGAALFPAPAAGISYGYQDNECPYRPNDGVINRASGLFRGLIGSVAVWGVELTREEVDRFATRLPNSQEIASYGSQLLSLWDMEEGKGNVLYDHGSLGNHVRFNPYPRAMLRAGPCARREKSKILGLWEVRTRTPREGVSARELYALAGGSISRAVADSNGKPYMEPIGHRIIHHQKPMPTSFQYSDFTYVCPGEGPVLRISRNKVTMAGLSAMTDLIQGGDLGWVEPERDATFWVSDRAGTVGAGGAFDGAKKYGYALTLFDEDSGTESRFSRFRFYTVEKATAGQQLDLLRLSGFPIPRDPHATHFRIYRTAANSGVFRYVDQIPITSLYYEDRTTDANLGDQLDTKDNDPPPLNVRIGHSSGVRAFYSGDDSLPGTFWWSKAGFPEIVPSEKYRATVSAGNQGAITGFASFNDQTLIFMQDSIYGARDNGGDIGLGSLDESPIQVGKIRDGIGAVNHHAIVTIPNVGVVFPGEKGIYVTDGYSFKCVTEFIQPTYDALDKSTYRQWHAVHWRRRSCYVLFCRTTDTSLVKDTTAGRINFAILWNYEMNRFVVWTDIDARWSTIVEDEATGDDRFYITDDFGGVFEIDPPDATVNNDGIGDLLPAASMLGPFV